MISRERIEQVIHFHGHFCPGLATGIRVAEVALAEVGRASQDEEIVAVVETKNCAVDAIQFLIGCTLGKGNLIVQDYGRNRFTFTRRSDGHAVRISAKPGGKPLTGEETALVERARSGQADAQEQRRYVELWQARGEAVLVAPLDELFTVEVLADYAPPLKAVIEPSLTCTHCGLGVLASKTREIDGQVICDACWEELGAQPFSTWSIGVVRSPLSAATGGGGSGGPRQAAARIELLPTLAPALQGLEVGQCLDVLWALDRSPRRFASEQHPRGNPDNPLRGIFALRTPHRLTPIAVTPVTLTAITGNMLTVEGMDAWDGSPVLDIKPSMRSAVSAACDR